MLFLCVHYHARWRPAAPSHELGPLPPTDASSPERNWLRHRETAARIAARWAEQLPRKQRRSFEHQEERIPRDRAMAGIHALLAHGSAPDVVMSSLSRGEQATVVTGAAVLEHRVNHLLHIHHIDPAPYNLPPPRSQLDEWHHAYRLLRAAEANHHANRSTSDLATEHKTLRTALRRSTRGSDDEGRLRDRLSLIDAAIARQLDRAAACLIAEPAPYLLAILGSRPENPAHIAAWQQRAFAIEHYRHYILGLPYGAAAAPAHAPATEQALGPPPADPAAVRRYRNLHRCPATLDLGHAS